VKLILSACLLLLSFAASAFQPRTGQWWDPAESGRGFNVEIQNGVMTLTVYTYDAAGNAQWYLASGSMTGGQHSFTAPLNKYADGQCAACDYRPATLAGNDGTVTVNFTTEVAGSVSLPSGHVSAIQPLNFGYGTVPGGMLGEWVFVEDVAGVSFADRFRFTEVGTCNGKAIALDRVKFAECAAGDTPEQVICADATPAGVLENGYIFTYGLDETFNGQWVAPSGNVYPMKGMRTASAQGLAKSAIRDDPLMALKVAQDAGGEKASADLTSALLELVARIRAATQ
jgi:hypothetical protein